MATFGLTPSVGLFPPPAAEDFPNFIQFQADGTDLGGADADTVDFVNGGEGAVTRGTGEAAGTVTVDLRKAGIPLQFQADGVDLGAADADTLNFVGFAAERVEDTVTVRPGPLTWRQTASDTVLDADDAQHGIVTTGTTGAQSVTVPADTGDTAVDLPTGTAVLLFQEGAATLEVQTESGVTLLCRDAFLTRAAGQYATLTLIKRAANTWLLCGDLALAE